MHSIDRKVYICKFVDLNKLIFAQNICSIIPMILVTSMSLLVELNNKYNSKMSKNKDIYIFFIIAWRKMVSGKALATA